MRFSNLMTLTKFNLHYFSFPRFSNKKDKTKYIVAMVFLGLVFLIPIGGLVAGLYFLVTATQDIEATRNLLSTLFALSQLVTLFFGVSTYLQVMYLAKDKNILATLPVSSAEIFISKIITVTAMELLVESALVLPTTIVTAVALAKIGAELTVWYFVLIPVAIITLPLLVILLISILSFPLMKIYSFFKKHQTLGAIFIVALIVGLMLAIYIPLYSNIGNNAASIPLDENGNPIEYTDEEIAAQNAEMWSETMKNIGTIGKYSFHTLALAKAMFNQSAALNALLYLGITLGAFAIGIALSIFLYNSTVQSLEENISISVRDSEKVYTETSYARSLVARDFKTTTRDMSKFINFLMAYVMGPLMAFIMIFIMDMNSKGAGENDYVFIRMFSRGFALGYSLFMIGGANAAASVGFSLEGKSFAILKTLPVKGVDIFKAKLRILDIASFLSVVVTLVIAAIMTKFNVIDIIGFLLCTTTIVLSMNAYSLKRDLKKPKLDWNIIKDITKNNMSTLVPLAIVLPAAIVAFGVPFIGIAFSNEYLASAVIWGIMLVVAVIYYFALRFKVYNNVDKMFEEVEC